MDDNSLTICLESDRLQLRTPDEAMAEAWFNYVSRNRDRFAAAGPKQDSPSLQTAREFIAGAQATLRRGTGIDFVILDRAVGAGRIIGDLSFSNIVRGIFLACHLGYRIDRDYEGRGYMREAAARALLYAFGELGLHRVMANYVPTNTRSARLLRRLGFSVEGYAIEYLMLNGRWEDHILTSLVAPAQTDGERQ